MAYSNVSIRATSIQAPVSAWSSVSESLSVTAGGSGSNPNQDEDQTSTSSSRVDAGSRKLRILIVDDSQADGYLMREAIDQAGVHADLVVLRDGHAAIQYFEMLDATEDSVCPDLILLDMNLPKKTGDEVLRHLRAGKRSKSAKVLIVSSSDAPQDRIAVEAMGIAGYFKKPSNYGDYMKLGPLVKDLLEPEP